MKNKKWDFLTQPEFYINTTIAIGLTFFAGFKTGQSKMIVSDPINSIVTQNQDGDNILINQEKPARKLGETEKKNINEILSVYNGKNIFISYLSSSSEAYDFSYEIKDYLEKKGYKVDISAVSPFGFKLERLSSVIDGEGILNFSIGENI